MLKFGVADAADMGTGASRRRTHILGFLKSAAPAANFEPGGIVTSPFLNKACLPKCVADFIFDRKAAIESDQLGLFEWIDERWHEHNEWWEIL